MYRFLDFLEKINSDRQQTQYVKITLLDWEENPLCARNRHDDHSRNDTDHPSVSARFFLSDYKQTERSCAVLCGVGYSVLDIYDQKLH